MTTETTAPKTRIITLTDRAPVSIIESDWPEIAVAKDWSGEHEFQATRRWSLRVRQHKNDGRTIVYGVHTSSWANERGAAAGELLTPPAGSEAAIAEDYYVWDEIPAAIHRVAERCGCQQIADACIADLPAQEI